MKSAIRTLMTELETLKLTYFGEHCEELAKQAADEGMSYLDFLQGTAASAFTAYRRGEQGADGLSFAAFGVTPSSIMYGRRRDSPNADDPRRGRDGSERNARMGCGAEGMRR